MPYPHAAWRVEFAQRLAEKIQPFQGVQAIVVAGSVALNYADEYLEDQLLINGVQVDLWHVSVAMK
jgi:hypothetical protein